ncbi:MAG: nicotinate (nicotinamide) nucleotide adenylyltransferase [Spirochaetales bacterium]|nr:nicotinate (nicotinamide) nucleotide adenylyltransferase [Spirochaetales bacterium]
MRLAMLGGSFNPPHIGHLVLAEEVLVECGYDRIVFVPAFMPPHKLPARDPGPQLRTAMLWAAIKHDARFMLETCEMDRKGISYTIDTLCWLRNRYNPDGKIGLIIGDDLAGDFLTTWRDPEAILKEADIIVAHRTTTSRPELSFEYRPLNNLLLPISSTLVRERIESGGAWRYLVPPAVREIIEHHGLYRIA